MYLFRRSCIHRTHITSENSRLKVWEECLCITDSALMSYILPACIILNIEWWQLLRAFEEWDIEKCCHIVLVMGNSCWLWNSDVKIRPLQKLNLEAGRVMQGDRSVPMQEMSWRQITAVSCISSQSPNIFSMQINVKIQVNLIRIISLQKRIFCCYIKDKSYNCILDGEKLWIPSFT